MKPTRHSLETRSKTRPPGREPAPRRDLPAIGDPDVHRGRNIAPGSRGRKKARLKTPRKMGSEYSGTG